MAEPTAVANPVRYIPTSKLKHHERNPRFIRDNDFDRLCESIEKHPDYFEARPILCNPDHIVFAGNMRLRAAKKLGLRQVPCIVMDIPEERQRELMIRDNVNNGQWDADMLAADFEMPELQEWGVPDFVFGGADMGQEIPEGETDYSDKNRELSLDDFADEMELKFRLTKDDFMDIQERLNVVMAKQNVDTKEDALKELLAFYERHG